MLFKKVTDYFHKLKKDHNPRRTPTNFRRSVKFGHAAKFEDYSNGRKEKGLTQCVSPFNFGSPTWTRTRDLRINSPSLYRLSYQGIEENVIFETHVYC